MSKVEAGFIGVTGSIDSVIFHNYTLRRIITEVRFRFYPRDSVLTIETSHGFTDKQIKTIRAIYGANPVGRVELCVDGAYYAYDTFVDRIQKGKFFRKLQSFILQSV